MQDKHVTVVNEPARNQLEQILIHVHQRDVTQRLRRIVIERLNWQEFERLVFAVVVGVILGTLIAIGGMR